VRFHAIEVAPDRIRLGDRRLDARLDPATGDAEVVVGQGPDARSHRLRAWTFAERRRLLAVHARGGAGVDVAALVSAAAELLVSPPPTEEAGEVLGLAALAWSAGGGSRQPAPVPGVDPASQTVALAMVTGWSPDTIDAAAACDVDAWYAATRRGATASTDPVVTDLGVTDLGVTDPGVTDPGVTDPGAGDGFTTFILEE